MKKLILCTALFLSQSLNLLWAQTSVNQMYMTGEFASVVSQVEAKQQSGQATPDEYIWAARSCEQLFHFEQAIDFYKQALALDSTSVAVNESIGNCWNALGDKRMALQAYSSILPSDTTNSVFWGKYAGVLMDLERFSDAQKVYSKLVEMEPSNAFFLRKLAISVYNQKDYEKSLPFISNYLLLKPNDLKMLMAQANCFQNTAQMDSAVVVLDRVLVLDSTSIDALSKLAYIEFINFKKYESALKKYRKLNELTGFSNLDFVSNQGFCEYFAGNFEEAIAILEQLMVAMPSPFVVLYTGLSYQKLGDLDKAIPYLEEAAELVIPMHTADFYYHLASAYALKRMYPEAIAYFEKVRELDSTNYNALYEMALIHDSWKRDFSTAFTFYKQYVESDTIRRNSSQYKYAQNRLSKIKEELFFEGN